MPTWLLSPPPLFPASYVNLLHPLLSHTCSSPRNHIATQASLFRSKFLPSPLGMNLPLPISGHSTPFHFDSSPSPVSSPSPFFSYGFSFFFDDGSLAPPKQLVFLSTLCPPTPYAVLNLGLSKGRSFPTPGLPGCSLFASRSFFGSPEPKFHVFVWLIATFTMVSTFCRTPFFPFLF